MSVTGAAPTGQVFNPDMSAFVVSDTKGHSGSSLFIFDTENGTIDGWSPAVDAKGTNPSRVTEVARNNGANAVYKGLAIAQNLTARRTCTPPTSTSGRVEAYSGTFKPVELPGGLFVDPRLPAGYGPFGIAEINGKLYVTFAKQDATLHDDVAGRGHGFVDVFTNDGAFVRRLVTRARSTRRGAWPWRRPVSASSAAICSSATSGTATSTSTARPPARTWASCDSRTAGRSSSTGSGACSSATGTPPRPTN